MGVKADPADFVHAVTDNKLRENDINFYVDDFASVIESVDHRVGSASADSNVPDETPRFSAGL